jgi:hypothetical protein
MHNFLLSLKKFRICPLRLGYTVCHGGSRLIQESTCLYVAPILAENESSHRDPVSLRGNLKGVGGVDFQCGTADVVEITKGVMRNHGLLGRGK